MLINRSLMKSGLVSIILITVASGLVQGAALSLDKSNYAPGENIIATFSGGPFSSTDWIGIYRATDTPGVQYAYQWQYTGRPLLIQFEAPPARSCPHLLGRSAKSKPLRSVVALQGALPISYPLQTILIWGKQRGPVRSP